MWEDGIEDARMRPSLENPELARQPIRHPPQDNTDHVNASNLLAIFSRYFSAFDISCMRLNILGPRIRTLAKPHIISPKSPRTMASSTPISVSDLTYVPPTRLASLLKESANTSADSANPSIAVIDVRDSDHIGGHIRSSTWVPSDQLPVKLPELVRTFADKDIVVFHCALSQQRGPSAALKYARERQRLLGTTKGNQDQKVCVLEGGFTMWQARYGEDESLTEGYVKDVWQY